MDINALTPEDKPKLRVLAYGRRNAAHTENAEATAQAIIAPALEATKDHARISTYMPIRSEVNVLPLMHELHAVGHEIGVPIIVGKGQPLVFNKWTPDIEMQKGPFGAYVPVNGVEIEPDLVLGALVAFDKTGTRLGYGGGYYDRTVAQFRAKQATPFIGIAYSAQELLKLPREVTDIPLDAIITEKGFRAF